MGCEVAPQSYTTENGTVTGPEAQLRAGRWTENGRSTSGYRASVGGGGITTTPDAPGVLTVGGPTCSTGITHNEDVTSAGGSCDAMSASVTLQGRAGRARIGVSEGVGLQGRLYHSRRAGYGFGVDVGPFSGDIAIRPPDEERERIEAQDRARAAQLGRDTEAANAEEARHRQAQVDEANAADQAAIQAQRDQARDERRVLRAHHPGELPSEYLNLPPDQRRHAAPPPGPLPPSATPAMSEEGQLLSDQLAHASPERAREIRAALAGGGREQAGGRRHVTIPNGGIYELTSRDLAALRGTGAGATGEQVAANQQAMGAAHHRARR